MRLNSKPLIKILIALVILLLVGQFFKSEKTNLPLDSSQNAQTLTNQIENTQSDSITTQDENQQITYPPSFQIEDISFASQAPFANWDELHDEACEEASIAIVYYYTQKNIISAELMEKEIQKMVEYQNVNWGGHFDLTTKKTAILAKNIYNLNLVEKEIVSLSDIKKEISQNHLVIVPTAGRLLGNPYFRSPGPVYHMLVISGYDEKTFTTQDVGTKRGKDYVYSQQILFNAIHNWNESYDAITSGRKTILVLE